MFNFLKTNIFVTTRHARHVTTGIAAHHAAHTGGTAVVAHHVTRTVGTSFFAGFKYRFLHSVVYTGTYRLFYRLGLIKPGQSLFLHALMVALIGCAAAWLFHKLYKHFK